MRVRFWWDSRVLPCGISLMMSRTAGMFHKLLKLIRNVRMCTQASILEWIPDHMLVFFAFLFDFEEFQMGEVWNFSTSDPGPLLTHSPTSWGGILAGTICFILRCKMIRWTMAHTSPLMKEVGIIECLNWKSLDGSPRGRWIMNLCNCTGTKCSFAI